MKPFRKKTECPTCHFKHDSHTVLEGDIAAPVPGDYTICFGCGAVAMFDRKVPGGLRHPTFVENAEIQADPAYRHAITAWRMTRVRQ